MGVRYYSFDKSWNYQLDRIHISIIIAYYYQNIFLLVSVHKQMFAETLDDIIK